MTGLDGTPPPPVPPETDVMGTPMTPEPELGGMLARHLGLRAGEEAVAVEGMRPSPEGVADPMLLQGLEGRAMTRSLTRSVEKARGEQERAGAGLRRRFQAEGTEPDIVARAHEWARERGEPSGNITPSSRRSQSISGFTESPAHSHTHTATTHHTHHTEGSAPVSVPSSHLAPAQPRADPPPMKL